MKTGTKSVLFGAHCFFIHPWFVAWAWCRLYGFPLDPRLWVAFFTHDLGYWGKALMDDEDGETHPLLGAWIMGRLFDRKCDPIWKSPNGALSHWECASGDNFWYNFSLLHSRYYAKRLGLPFSRLCIADKLAITLTPRWLYLPMVNWTGEIHEYLSMAAHADTTSGRFHAGDYQDRQVDWHIELCRYMREWVEAHKDGAQDTWTSNDRHAKKSGTAGS
jgi:hypothetical protein